MLTIFAIVASLAGVAQAAPITMSPGPVTLPGVRGDFTLSLTSGDTSNNKLVFGLTGSNPSGSLPAFGVASLVFDGVSVVSAGELSDADGLINGITGPGSNALSAVLIDFGSPSSASFFVMLSGTPTSATLYSVAPGGGNPTLQRNAHLSWISRTPLTFEGGPGEAIPEPTAALCFAAGLMVVATRLRRP